MECVYVWVGSQSRVVSRDCEHQHQHQLEHQQSRGGLVPFPRGTAGFWNGLGSTVGREVTGTGAACPRGERPRSDLCCVWKSFRYSDAQVCPPIVKTVCKDSSDRGSSNTARAPLVLCHGAGRHGLHPRGGPAVAAWTPSAWAPSLDGRLHLTESNPFTSAWTPTLQ